MTYLVGGYPATKEQEHAIKTALAGQHARRSLKITAGAGSGKTSILKTLANHLEGKGLYIAFNKTIADEAQLAFDDNKVTSKTAHSLAFAAVGHKYKKRFGRLHGAIVVEHLNNEAFGRFNEIQLANLALAAVRQYCYSDDDKIMYQHVPSLGREDRYDYKELLDHKEHIALLARRIWKAMVNEKSRLPVTHDFYLKLWALSKPQLDYDFIFLDEAQDSNAVLIDLLRRQPAQMILVGDRYQSVYGWRGATNAMADMRTDDEARITQSFRFGLAIADMANLVLTHHLKTDFQIRGFDQVKSSIGKVDNPNAIVCRTNQTAMRETLALMAQGKSATFIGDSEQLIQSIKAIGDLKRNGFTLHSDFKAFGSYKELTDYAQTDEGLDYSVLLKMVNEHGQQFLINKLEVMKADNNAEIEVITAHKAKGREWDEVILAEDFIMPIYDRWTEEEGNLLYVAVTRAKMRLDVTRLKIFSKLVQSQLAA